jgi:hypothetical protein
VFLKVFVSKRIFMGCHTWFYKKIAPQPTYNEVKENVLKHLKKNIDFYDRMIIGDIDADLLEAYPEWTAEYGIKYKSILERQIKFVEKDLCYNALYNRYNSDITSKLTININGILYIETDYHDVFRKYNYPTDKLFSLKETLEYIEKYKDEIYIYEDTFEILEQFWLEYPDGVIKFG